MKKKSALRYKVLSINVDKLIFTTSFQKFHQEHPSFFIDFSEGTSSYCCDTNHFRPNNALFFQICECIKISNPNPDSLYKEIVFLDFSDYFQYIHAKKLNQIIDDIDSPSGPPPFSTADYISTLLDPNGGIKIKFSRDEDPVEFVAFDKSSSMARNCRISFVNKAILDELNERICLGIDFNCISKHNEGMPLSKYYAYRGLMLSTADRVSSSSSGNASDFILNENTVIVVDDYERDLFSDVTPNEPDSKINSEGKKVFNSYPKQYTLEKASIDQTGEESNVHHFGTVRKEFDKVNVFDGEGLISPGYANYINQIIHPNSSRTANSFQIRMPFVKGCIHSVDFHKFIRDNFNSKIPTIKDCYGIERKLDDAQIILTKSMFKCKEWLKLYCEIKNISSESQENCKCDYLKIYFERLHKYNHTLYISDDDTKIRQSSYERLNYQFLSTLTLTPEEFDGLIEKHFEYGEEAIAQQLTRRDDENTFPIIAASKINRMFCNEPLLIDRIKRQLRGLRIDCGMGNLYTIGHNRFLSADLLEFLLYITADLEYAGFCATKDRLKNSILTTSSFVPKSNLFKKNKGYHNRFAILRNPHLSQNEDCLSSPNLKQNAFNGNDKDPHEEYFSKLTGVIMIPTSNLFAMSLSGADFDGDRVKIYSDASIVKSIRNSCYHDDENMIQEGDLRTKPIVVIPPETGPKLSVSEINVYKKLIVNTFSNQTGKISNIALSFAIEEYKCSNKIEDFKVDKCKGCTAMTRCLKQKFADDYCARCTAITGLEIDAVKKGKHPNADIAELEDACKTLEKAQDKYCTGTYFIKRKNAIKKLRGKPIIYIDNVDGNDSEYILKQSKSDNKGIKIVNPKLEDPVHNLIRLPFIFAQREYESIDNPMKDEQKAKEILKATQGQPYFSFEAKNPLWSIDFINNGAYKSKKNKINKLIKAYFNIRKDIRKYYKILNEVQYNNPFNMLLTILRCKYDFDHDSLALTEDIQKLLNESISFIRQRLSTYSKAIEGFNILQKYWISAVKENRQDILRNILGMTSEECIDPQISLFLTDFSSHGYYILYYIIKIIIKEYKTILPVYDLLRDDIDNHKKGNEYYSILIDLFDKYGSRSSYENYSLSEDFSYWDTNFTSDDSCSNESFCFDNNETDFEQTLHENCLSLLWEIVGCKNLDNPSYDDIENLIKHLWIRRQDTSILWKEIEYEDLKHPAPEDYEKLKQHISTSKKYISSTTQWKKSDDNGRFFWSVIDIEYIKLCAYKSSEVKNAKRKTRT